jgi:hypothetical protein
MEITLGPTTSMHQIKIANPDDLPYARLWIGVTEEGYPVQALIFGCAFFDGHGTTQAEIELVAVELPDEIPKAWPPIVVAPRVPGTYEPPKGHLRS